jgi:hypothetical protein
MVKLLKTFTKATNTGLALFDQDKADELACRKVIPFRLEGEVSALRTVPITAWQQKGRMPQGGQITVS